VHGLPGGDSCLSKFLSWGTAHPVSPSNCIVAVGIITILIIHVKSLDFLMVTNSKLLFNDFNGNKFKTTF
jgi:hypothetical protein